MSNIVTIGKRLIPLEHVAFIEPFDPTGQTRIQTDRPFQARVVLLDRESVLTEEALAAFAEKHAFRALSEDGIAVNPAVRFNVEAFSPMDGFTPPKPYRTRLMWRDRDGQTQSKLLVTDPETVLAIVIRGSSEPSTSATQGGGGRSRRMQASSFRPN